LGNVSLVKYLIELIANPTKEINQGYTSLGLNKKNRNGDSSIMIAIHNNNIEIVKLLMDYANKHNIILQLNEKNEDGNSIMQAINNDNTEIVKLLMEYADNHNIVLELNEKKTIMEIHQLCLLLIIIILK